MKEQDEEITIDLVQLWKAIKKQKAFVGAVTAVCVAAGAGYLAMAKPMYESTALLKIEQKQELRADVINQQTIIAGNLPMGVSNKSWAANNYAEIIKSKSFINEISNNAESHNLENSVVNASVKKNTELIAVSVTSANAEDAQKGNELLVEKFQQKVATEKLDMYSGLEGQSYMSIKIVDAPTVGVPSAKKTKVVLLGALIAGLFGSCGFVSLRELLNRTMKTSEDAERYLDLPVLASVPQTAEAELVAIKAPQSAITEVYRTIRTYLQYSLAAKDKNVIAVTSTIAGEGKSVLCSNLAVLLAQAGKKVLLVDANLRNAAQGKLFGLQGNGLCEYLIGKSSKANIQDTTVANLQVLASGAAAGNAAELLESDKMQQFLSAAKEYDYVILDTPAIEQYTDAVVLGAVADGVVFTVGQRMVTPETAYNSKEKLEQVGADVLGVVFNKVED